MIGYSFHEFINPLPMKGRSALTVNGLFYTSLGKKRTNPNLNVLIECKSSFYVFFYFKVFLWPFLESVLIDDFFPVSSKGHVKDAGKGNGS